MLIVINLAIDNVQWGKALEWKLEEMNIFKKKF